MRKEMGKEVKRETGRETGRGKEMRKFALGLFLGFSIVLGCVILRDTTEIQAKTDVINMDRVVKIETTETGALFTFLDGTGYYWEKGEKEMSEKKQEKKQEEKQEVSKDWVNMNQVTNIKVEDGVFTITVKMGNDYHNYVWEK